MVAPRRLAFFAAAFAAAASVVAPARAETTAAGQFVACRPGGIERAGRVLVACRLAHKQVFRTGAGVAVACRANLPARFDARGALVTCWAASPSRHAVPGGGAVACLADQVGFAPGGALVLCRLDGTQRFAGGRAGAIACAGGDFAGFGAGGRPSDCRLAEDATVPTASGAIPCLAGRPIAFFAASGLLKSCALVRAMPQREPSGRPLLCRAGGLVHFEDRTGRFATCNI